VINARNGHYRNLYGALCLNCEGSGYSIFSPLGSNVSDGDHPIKTYHPYPCPFCQGKRLAAIPLADVLDPDCEVENPEYYWTDHSGNLIVDASSWRSA
jgi:hypothetical protein